jgi:hypothetical protein
MNAYELANKLDGWSEDVYGGGEQIKESANMLRQQADRIAELEKENANLKYEISSSAWQPKEATDQELFNIYAHLQDTYKGDNFPVALGRKILKLYTTPQTSKLSDEEIDHAWFNYGWGSVDKSDLIKFARTIEAKARGDK